MWVATIGQGGVIRLAALNSTAQVIHQRFAHQVFRKIAPGLRPVVGAYARQDPQPGFITRRLQIAETTPGMHRFGFDVDIASVELESFLVFQPVKGCRAFLYLQRSAEDGFVRHFRIMDVGHQTAIFHAAFQSAAEMLGTRQQFPLLPGKIGPCDVEAGFFRRLQWNIEGQSVNRPNRLGGLPHFAQRGGEFRRDSSQPFKARQFQITGTNT